MQFNNKERVANTSKVFSELISDAPVMGFVLSEFLTKFDQRLNELKDSSVRLISAVHRLDSSAFSEEVSCLPENGLEPEYRGVLPRLDQQLVDLYNLNNIINDTLNKLEKYI